MAGEQVAAALASAAGTPTAVRTEPSASRVPYGATVVDAEFTSASVQFQWRDLHVAIVLGYAEAGGLTVADVQALLGQLLDQAREALE